MAHKALPDSPPTIPSPAASPTALTPAIWVSLELRKPTRNTYCCLCPELSSATLASWGVPSMPCSSSSPTGPSPSPPQVSFIHLFYHQHLQQRPVQRESSVFVDEQVTVPQNQFLASSPVLTTICLFKDQLPRILHKHPQDRWGHPDAFSEAALPLKPSHLLLNWVPACPGRIKSRRTAASNSPLNCIPMNNLIYPAAEMS